MPLLALLPLMTTAARPLPDMSVTPTADMIRLARTPSLDGRLDPDEWQPFTTNGDVATFFQWEPSRLHVAGTLPVGQALVASIDLKGDGWLVGRDNLEVRVAMSGGQPEITARLLNATHIDGPVWEEIPAFLDASRVAATERGESWTVEATLTDAGFNLFPTDVNSTLRLRLDGHSGEAQSLPATGSRATAPMWLGFTMAKNPLPGAVWKPEYRTRTVVPGEEFRIRYTWSFGESGSPIQQYDIRAMGPVATSMATITKPFPSLDKKRRAYIDYETRVAENAPLGWHVLKGTAIGGPEQEYSVYTSFRVAPLVDFDLVPSTNYRAKEEPQQIKLTAYIRSNSPKRLDGEVTLSLPTGWEAKSGQEKPFIIYSPRGSVRRVYEVAVPGGARGVYPLTFRATIGDHVIDQTAWVRLRD